MIVPDYRDFIRSPISNLQHSAKGSTWENHKYIKRIDGLYYYPDSYKGGRNLTDAMKSAARAAEENLRGKQNERKSVQDRIKSPSKSEDKDNDDKKRTKDYSNELGDEEPSSDDVEKLAKEVIRGNFGNGQERKDLLGKHYSQIQDRVNEILLGSSYSKKVSEASDETIKKVEKLAKKSSKMIAKDTKVHTGVDLNQVLSIYKKRR